MEVKRTMNPGEPGTRKLAQAYGEKLVCVRYRYNASSHKRLTTVELIVDEKPWYSSRHIKPNISTRNKPPGKVFVKVFFSEAALRERVKNAGGVWSKEKRLWLNNYPICDGVGFAR